MANGSKRGKMVSAPVRDLDLHKGTLASVERRWESLPHAAAAREALLDMHTQRHVDEYAAHVEHFIGAVKTPVGLAGPLRVNGNCARGDYFIPLATTEAALVASYHRGAQLVTAAGGCRVALIEEGVGRSPGFVFASLDDALAFVAWVQRQHEGFARAAATTTRHGKLSSVETTIAGNHVFVTFMFSTGDAAGQNMATLAAQAICDYIMAECPVRPLSYAIEANYSRDKRQTARAFSSVRGRKVTAEITLPTELVRQRLRVTPQQMADYVRMATVAAIMNGSVGIHGQIGNAMAALFLACGQDIASVVEASVGVSRAEVTPNGDLYATITLPNLIVGTVGGGTRLPSQRACLDILNLPAEHSSQAFAEVCAAICLAGELSLVGALCSGDFTRAHRVLGRSRRNGRSRHDGQS